MPPTNAKYESSGCQMKSHFYRQNAEAGVWIIRITILGLLLLSAPIYSQESGSQVVPELLDLPSGQKPYASQTVQLAVTRAGDRLVSVGEQGVILLSDDQGRSWRQSSGVPVSVTLTDVEFISESEGWASGHSGVLLRTTDAGENWTKVVTGDEIVESIQQAAELLPASTPNAERLKRNAGFLTGNEPILDIHFSDDGRGWLLGAYGIALTSDNGGDSWQPVVAGLENPNAYHLYQIVESDDGGQLIVGERGLVMGSEEHANVYDALQVNYEGTFFGAVSLKNGDYLLFGLRGNAWRGRGDTWNKLAHQHQVSFAAAIAMKEGAILGDQSGRLFYLAAQSAGLTELPYQFDSAITDFEFSPSGELIVATARGLKRLNLDTVGLDRESIL